MRKSLLIILLTGSSLLHAQNQNNPATLTPVAMREDFDYLRNMLETTAPGLYAHQSPERVRVLFDSLRATLQEPLPYISFYARIAFMIAELHCEHSQALPAGKMADKAFAGLRFFPIQPDFTGKQPIVMVNATSDTTIHPGDEIVSINGILIDEIRRKIYRFLPGDGFITTGKDQSMSSMNFGFFYNLFIEQPLKYDVVFRTRNGQLINRLFEKGTGTADINRNAYANPVNKRIFEVAARLQEQRKNKFLLELMPEKQAAFLTVRSFGIDKTVFEKTIDSLFTRIRQNGVRNLVINLSYNDGGEEERAAYLLSYLVNKPTPYVESEYLLTDKDEHLALANGIPQKIRKNKYAYIEPLKDGRSMVKLSEYSRELATIEPHSDRFAGKVFLYVNGGTASAASTFAAVAQSNRLATIVGQETAGSYKGGGVAIGIDLTLPNSGIRTHSSLAFMNFATSGKDGCRGTIPDYVYVPGFDEVTGDGTAWKQFIAGLF